LNKGLEIRNNKLKKQMVKRNTIKEEQKNLCRYVSIKYQIIKKVNNKYKHIGEKIVNGLQIKNRIYLENGSYKLINGKGARIKNIYDDIPTWATDEMIEKQNKFNQL
jgi:hypothetical protein